MARCRAGCPRQPLQARAHRLEGVVSGRSGSQDAKSIDTGRVTGEGHAFWVDAASGYTRADQDALLDYLLSVDALTQDMPVP